MVLYISNIFFIILLGKRPDMLPVGTLPWKPIESPLPPEFIIVVTSDWPYDPPSTNEASVELVDITTKSDYNYHL